MPERIRIRADFELTLEEEGLPDWLFKIPVAGVQHLLDKEIAKGEITFHPGARYRFTRITGSELKRRETKGRKAKEKV